MSSGSKFRRVTARIAVSGQVSAADVAAAADEGFRLIINNRPDGEAPDQPPAADIEAAARSLGMAYVAIPVTGRPTLDQARAMRAEIGAHRGSVLAFCRSGTRSILTWAAGELDAGVELEEVRRAAAAAGYDLSAWLGPPGNQ